MAVYALYEPLAEFQDDRLQMLAQVRGEGRGGWGGPAASPSPVRPLRLQAVVQHLRRTAASRRHNATSGSTLHGLALDPADEGRRQR